MAGVSSFSSTMVTVLLVFTVSCSIPQVRTEDVFCRCDRDKDECVVCDCANSLCQNENELSICFGSSTSTCAAKGSITLSPCDCTMTEDTKCYLLQRSKMNIMCGEFARESSIPTMDATSPMDATLGSADDTSTILAATLSIVILALLITAVAILLLYWRYRLKAQRERSYNVNSSVADPPAVHQGPLYSELDQCSNDRNHHTPHLRESHTRPALENPGYSSTGPAQLRYNGLEASSTGPARDYEQPCHSIQQSAGSESPETLRDSKMGTPPGDTSRNQAGVPSSVPAGTTAGTHPASAGNTCGRMERIGANIRRGDSTNGYGRMETIDAREDTTNAYDTMERIDANTRRGDTTNAYDTMERIDANVRRGDTPNAYDTMERIDANTRRGDTTNAYDTMERIDANVRGDTTNAYDTMERIDANVRRGNGIDDNRRREDETTRMESIGDKTANDRQRADLLQGLARHVSDTHTVERINTNAANNKKGDTASSYDTAETIGSKDGGRRDSTNSYDNVVSNSTNPYNTVESHKLMMRNTASLQEEAGNRKHGSSFAISNPPVARNGTFLPHQSSEYDYARLNTDMPPWNTALQPRNPALPGFHVSLEPHNTSLQL